MMFPYTSRALNELNEDEMKVEQAITSLIRKDNTPASWF
jgi:hypothetical protein